MMLSFHKFWIQEDADIYSAKCKVCSRSFSVAGQGRKALDTYAKGLKHQQHLRNLNSILKTAFAVGQQKTDQAAALNKHSFSLLQKIKQQKKL